MKFWLIFVFGIGLITGNLGYKFWQYAQQPAPARNREEDILVVMDGRQLRDPTDTPDGMIKYRGGYMTFMYPAAARKYPLKKADDTILERADFELDNPRISIVATASQIKEKRLEEVPGVTMRRSQTDKYREDMVVVGVDKNPVFTTLDNREKIVFVMYKDHLYTLAVYGSDPNEVKSIWQKILPTFHFI